MRAATAETSVKPRLTRSGQIGDLSNRARLACAVLIGLGVSAPSASGQAPATRPASPAKAVIVPLPSVAPRTAAPQAPPSAPAPPPDIWSESEIADAKRVCQEALKSMSAAIVTLPPVKKGRCGAPAPVRLVSIGKKNPVKFVPPPTVSCTMLVPLRRWIDKGLQRRAARYLDTRVTEVAIMSSYSCRTRYGRKGAKMSEHAFANALDIGGFRLADGTRVSVLKDWGPTRRDIAAQVAQQKAALAAKQKAADTAKQAAPAAPQPARAWTSSTQAAAKRPGAGLPPVRIRRPSARSTEDPALETARLQLEQPARGAQPTARQRTVRAPAPNTTPNAAKAAPDRTFPSIMPPLPTRRPLRQSVRRRINIIKADPRPQDRALRSPSATPLRQFAKPPYRLGGPKASSSAPRARFLRGIHQSACRIFGTTLGPEANEAHRNHFHFDMFPRRNGGYCE